MFVIARVMRVQVARVTPGQVALLIGVPAVPHMTARVEPVTQVRAVRNLLSPEDRCIPDLAVPCTAVPVDLHTTVPVDLHTTVPGVRATQDLEALATRALAARASAVPQSVDSPTENPRSPRQARDCCFYKQAHQIVKAKH
jgi:hypothetical protein